MSVHDYEEEEQVHKAEAAISVDLTTDKLEGEVAHTHDFGVFVYIIVICICSYIGTFDAEIRCALGNMQKCATMAVIQPMQGNSK